MRLLPCFALLIALITHVLADGVISRSTPRGGTRLAGPPPAILPLQLGEVTTGTATGSDSIQYVFQGTAGQRLLLDGLDTLAAAVPLGLVSPGGTLVLAGHTGTDTGPITLVETGRYALTNGVGLAPGDFHFRLLDADLYPAGALGLGTTVQGTLNAGDALAPVRGLQLFRWSAKAGERVALLPTVPTDPSAVWTLFGPHNQVLGSAPLRDSLTVSLPADGTNLLTLVAGLGAEPVAYQFITGARTLSREGLNLGAPTEARIASPGAEAQFTFAATAGHLYFFDALEVGEVPAVAKLLNPDGNVELDLGDGLHDRGPFVARRTGTYALAFSAVGDALLTNLFRLVAVDDSPELVSGAWVTNSVAFPRESRVYRFTAQKGQTALFADLPPAGSFEGEDAWSIYAPYGERLFFSTNLTQDPGPIPVLVPGTYALVAQSVEPPGGGAGGSDYRFRFELHPPDTNLPRTGFDYVTSPPNGLPSPAPPLFLPSFLATRLTAPAGTPFLYVSLTNAGLVGPLVVDLYDLESSEYLWNGYSAASTIGALGGSSPLTGPYLLPRSAQYLLFIRVPEDDRSGGRYHFFSHLINLDDAAVPLAFNSIVEGVLPTPDPTIFSFNGTAGDWLYLDALLGSLEADQVRFRVVGPSGAPVLGPSWLGGDEPQSAAVDYGPFLLQETGRHFLIVENAALQNPGRYRFRVLDLPGSGATALTVGVPVGGAGPAALELGPFETRVYRFAGPAQQRLVVDSLAGPPAGASEPSPPSWTLVEANETRTSVSLGVSFQVTTQAEGVRWLALQNPTASTVRYGFTIGYAPPQLVAVAVGTAGVTLEWSASAGVRYRVESRPAAEQGLWTDLSGDLEATGPTAAWNDSGLSGVATRFYRIVVVE